MSVRGGRCKLSCSLGNDNVKELRAEVLLSGIFSVDNNYGHWHVQHPSCVAESPEQNIFQWSSLLYWAWTETATLFAVSFGTGIAVVAAGQCL